MKQVSRSRLGCVVFVGCVGLALLACKKKPPPDPVSTAPTQSPLAAREEAARPKVKRVLEQIAGVAAKAKAEKRVTTKRGLKTKLETKQFVTLGDKWLAAPNRLPEAGEVPVQSNVLSICASRLEKPQAQTADTTQSDVDWLEECAALEYVAVVRPRKVGLPKVNLATKTFTPGSYEGDMLLFELASGEIKGRYPLNITNSDELTYLEGSAQDSWDKEAQDDLGKNVTGVIRETLQLERE